MYHNQILTPTLDWSMVDFDATTESFSDGSLSDFTFKADAAAEAPTPPKTPVVCCGPRLIPRVRIQDQVAEPAAVATSHRSKTSVSSTGFPINPMQYGQFADMARRSASPGTSFQLLTPVSDKSSRSSPGIDVNCSMYLDNTPSRPSLNHGRSISTSAVPSHTRHSSSSSIDEATLQRYGFPTYRNTPQSVSFSGRPRTASALSHLIPMPMPAAPMSSVANFTQSRPITPPRLQEAISMISNSSKICSATTATHNTPSTSFAAIEDPPTSTLHAYLSSPNPSPSLVQRLVEPSRSQLTHFWFDIRNLRRWTSFNPKTISSLPDLLPFLHYPLPVTSLPTPAPSDPAPETLSQLHTLLASHFALKVNAALKIFLGPQNALEMRSLHCPALTNNPAYRPQPEFLSAMPTDTERTFDSLHRGRVIGIVRSYEQWNSGMRSGQGPAGVVKYLAGLGALHHFLREHGCRYGFIITEIELVCVRYGGDDGAEMPFFGFLEVADPIRLSTFASPLSACQQRNSGGQADEGEGGELLMTAPLALFYLHLLAKSQPLPGQWHWKLDIGGPAALTRQKCCPRDKWMPKPQTGETRVAKRNRGWVWPEEGFSRKELGGRRKRM